MILRILDIGWKAAGYIILITGLIMSGRVDKKTLGLERELPSRSVELSAATSSSAEIGEGWFDEVPIYLAVNPPDFALEEFAAWLATKPSFFVDATVYGPDGEADTLRLGPPEWKRGDARNIDDRVVLAEGSVSLDEGSHRIEAEMTNADPLIAECAPHLILGTLPEQVLPKSVQRMLDPRGALPGLLMLGGGSIVFIHLFFLAAFFCLPWREDGPGVEELEADFA